MLAHQGGDFSAFLRFFRPGVRLLRGLAIADTLREPFVLRISPTFGQPGCLENADHPAEIDAGRPCRLRLERDSIFRKG